MPRSQQADNGTHRHSQTPYAGFATHYIRVKCNAL